MTGPPAAPPLGLPVARREGCPKAMTHGPCGGVEAGGQCELGDRRCVFVDSAVVPWLGPARAPAAGAVDPLLAGVRPIILADLPDRPLDAPSVQQAAAALAEHVDATLFGDTGWARVQFSPSYRASLVAAEGVRPWAGLNCRDRNRVALEAELHGLADAGAAVHCVTGDHTKLGDRPDAEPVFDLDSTQLAALAHAAGLLVSVAENPVAPPVEWRPARAVEKARAGAQVCIVNHAGTVERLRGFVSATQALLGGEQLRFLVCVPLVTTVEGLALIRTFTALALPPRFAETIEAARDPFVAGVDQAVRFARAALDVPGVAGVDLGAVYPPGSEESALAATIAVAAALRGR